MKVIRHYDEMVLLIEDDQVLAVPLVGPREQKMRIANGEGKAFHPGQNPDRDQSQRIEK